VHAVAAQCALFHDAVADTASLPDAVPHPDGDDDDDDDDDDGLNGVEQADRS